MAIRLEFDVVWGGRREDGPLGPLVASKVNPAWVYVTVVERQTRRPASDPPRPGRSAPPAASHPFRQATQAEIAQCRARRRPRGGV